MTEQTLMRQIMVATLAALGLPAFLVLVQTAGLAPGLQSGATALYLSILAGPLTIVGWGVCVLNIQRVKRFVRQEPQTARRLWTAVIMPFIGGALLALVSIV